MNAVTLEKIDQLQTGWLRLLERLGVEPAAALPVFDRLVEQYSEPHRHYHNLEHISEMLRTAGKLADLASNLMEIQLAIWFHDAVYDPRAKDNEERSAAQAEAILRPFGVAADSLQRIADLILLTRHTSATAIGDAAILLDCDLAILGADPKRYARYAADIRQEYEWVPDEEYRRGRSPVLQSFLTREKIYSTTRMFEVGEAAARSNMAAELESIAY